MTPRPVYAFALRTLIERIMGFPDIVGHQTVYIIFINRVDGQVAVNASGKQPGIAPIDADLPHDLFELSNETVGCDEDMLMISPHFFNFPASGNQDSIIFEPGIEILAGTFGFVDRVITQNTEPFGQGSQGFVNSKTVVHNNLGIQEFPNSGIQGFQNLIIQEFRYLGIQELEV
jgi:hypothetical protein